LAATLAQWAEGAQLFIGLGDFHRAVSTSRKSAQAYFDQGMRFLWAFNHDESTRSFAKAAQEDPNCAMCYWGVALTVGIAAAQGADGEAIRTLTQALDAEDRLAYDEPPTGSYRSDTCSARHY
jgi:hypothetical protein